MGREGEGMLTTGEWRNPVSNMRAAIGTPFKSPHTTRRETVGVFYPSPTVPNLNYLVVVIVQGNFLHSLLSLIARNVF